MTVLQELLKKADQYREKINAGLTEDQIKELKTSLFYHIAYNDNAMEGNSLSKSEVKALADDKIYPKDKALQDCQEIEGYANAYKFMEFIAEKEGRALIEADIKEMNYLLCERVNEESAGSYRKEDIQFSENGHNPPKHEDLTHLMEHLIMQIDTSKYGLHPVELAAMVHKRLLDIYPFEEGNGCTARLLMNYILLNNGYIPITVPVKYKEQYKAHLLLSQTKYDTDPFVTLIVQCLIDAEIECCNLYSIE